jgi:ABC-type antimicrobial peptide transport system permease subunit
MKQPHAAISMGAIPSETFETMIGDKLSRFSIIGYVRDARYLNMREPMHPTAYLLFDSKPSGVDWATFVVRTTNANPLDVAPALRREVTRARPEFRVVNIRTQTELVEQHTVRERLLAMLSLFFASVALVLAAVGLYGVLNYSVVQRRREIGIRMALGSSSAAVARRITSEICSMLLLGALAGLGAGVASEHFLQSLLYHVTTSDVTLLALPALTIFGAALIAALPPVIHAVRTDPALALRAD